MSTRVLDLPRRTWAAALVALVTVALTTLTTLAAGPAWAHASLVDSSPRQGDRLDAPPSEVRFEFSQDMAAPAYVVVTAPDGSSVTTGDPVVDGPVVRQSVTDGPDGSWSMAYRAVSEDGHPISGEITFVVGEGEDPGSTDPGSPGSPAAAEDETAMPDAAAGGATTQAEDTGSARDRVALTVGALLFAGAGVLYLLSRRART